MANQIKGKYIKNGAIDGSKVLLLNDQALRAVKTDGSAEELLKLDSSNNLVLLKVPQVSADASGGNDLVRKSQLDSVVAAETTARQAAVSELSTRIDNVLSNVDSVALNSLAEIVTAFQEADNDLNGAISSLASSAASGLEAETTARQAADLTFLKLDGSRVMTGDLAMGEESVVASTYYSNISRIGQMVGGGSEDHEFEFTVTQGETWNISTFSARVRNFQGLTGTFTMDILTTANQVLGTATVPGASVPNDSQLAAGTDDYYNDFPVGAMIAFNFASPVVLTGGTYKFRVSVQSGLIGMYSWSQGPNYIIEGSSAEGYSYKIVNLADGTSASDAINKGQLDAESSARQAADTTLQSNINAEASARASAVSSEASARQAADTTLQSNINAEASARASAVSSEASARQAADDAEQSARQAADTTLQSNIDAEISARQAADASLQSQIDNLGSSGGAALAQEISDRQSGDSALQSNIDSEASARQSAVSAEQSAREAADSALQAAIDALTADDLTDVSTASKADGDLFQWDSSEGKWKNVAPLTEASTTTVVVPGSEQLVSSFTATTDYNDGTGAALGTTYRPTSNMTVSKFGLKFGRTNNLTGTVTAKIYEVASQIVTGHSFSYNPADFTLLGTSTNSLSPSDIALYPAAAQMEYFTFNNVQLNQDGYYLIWVEVDGVSFGTTTVNYLAPTYAVGYFPNNHYKQSQTDAQIAGDFNLTAGYEIYTGSAGSESTVAEVGVIKTNSDGLLDDSFIDVTIARSSDLASETSARQSADSTLQSNIDAEVSARQSAVSSEASTRQSADQTLQDNIDSEVSARQAADASLQSQIDNLGSSGGAALAQEISDRQSGDSALQSNIDAEASSREAADSALDTRVQAVEAVAVQFAKQKMIVTEMDIMNGYVDLSHQIVNESLVAFVDRLAIHEDDDYTLSVVNNLTRVTFAGNLVDPSEEKLADGDILRFTYAYLSISNGGGGGEGGGTPSISYVDQYYSDPVFGAYYSAETAGVSSPTVVLQAFVDGEWTAVGDPQPVGGSVSYNTEINPIADGSSLRIVMLDQNLDIVATSAEFIGFTV